MVSRGQQSRSTNVAATVKFDPRCGMQDSQSRLTGLMKIGRHNARSAHRIKARAYDFKLRGDENKGKPKNVAYNFRAFPINLEEDA